MTVSRALPPALVVAVLAAPACDGGEGPALGPPAVVEGRWSYDAVLRRPGAECVLSGATIRIRRDGDRLSGSVSEFSVRCGDGLCRVAGAPLREGTVRGNQVSFRFRGLRHAGQVKADLMRGRVTSGEVELPCEGDEAAVADLSEGSGDWTARL